MLLGSSRVRAVVIFVVPLLFLTWMQWIKLQSAAFYRDINLENHIIQNLQVVALAIGATLLFITSRRLSTGPRYMRLAVIFGGLALVFLIGEELQWGQYMFHFQPPAYFATNNTEKEFNLHNLPTEQHLLDYIFMAVGLLGGLAWLVRARAGRLLLSVIGGIFGGWVLRNQVDALVLAGKSFSGRSLYVQLAIVAVGAVIAGLVVAVLLTAIASIGGGRVEKWPVPPWFLSLYFLPLAVYAFLWRVLTMQDFLGGSFNAWQPFLAKYLVWSDQEPAELLFYSALLMISFSIFQLVRRRAAEALPGRGVT